MEFQATLRVENRTLQPKITGRLIVSYAHKFLGCVCVYDVQ